MKILDNIGLGHLYDKLKTVFLRNGYGVTWDKTAGNVEIRRRRDNESTINNYPYIICTQNQIIIGCNSTAQSILIDGITTFTMPVSFTHTSTFSGTATFSDTVQFQKTATFDGGMNINSCAINTINGIHLSLTSSSNEMCISGDNDTELVVNYRKAHNGHAPKFFTWRDGTSSGYATHRIGELQLVDTTGRVDLTAAKLRKLLALV